MATYSREYLQSYRQNFQTIQLCESIVKQVLQKAGELKTRYVHSIPSAHRYPVGNGNYVEMEKLIPMLKERFPDCLVEYQEVKNIHGKIESGIVVDWS